MNDLRVPQTSKRAVGKSSQRAELGTESSRAWRQRPRPQLRFTSLPSELVQNGRRFGVRVLVFSRLQGLHQPGMLMASWNPVHGAGEVRCLHGSAFQWYCWRHCVLHYSVYSPPHCRKNAARCTDRCNILSTAICLRVTLRVRCLQLQALQQDLELSEATGRDLTTLLKWEKHKHKQVPELGSLWLWTCA